MVVGEVAKLNSYLIGLKGSNLRSKIFIDNLHCPYFEFEEEYILPSISVLEDLDYDSAKVYLEGIASFIPELISGLQVLPFARPRKGTGKLFLVQRIEGEQEFLLIIVFDVAHLGGIHNDKIIQKSHQSKTISVKTNRIYFTIKVIPIKKLILDQGNIVNFDAFEITEWIDKQRLNRKRTESELENRIRPFSDLFDEADFSTQEKMIADHLRINRDIWKPGKVYNPVGIDHLCFSMRFLERSKNLILSTWENVRSSFWGQLMGNEGTEISSNNFLLDYLSCFHSSLDYSPSGNPRWLIEKRNNL